MKKFNKAYEKFLTSNIKKNKFDLYKDYFDIVKKAAYMGDSEAQFILGSIYDQDDYGLELLEKKYSKEYRKKKALYWYNKACSNSNAMACHNLGGIYGMGIGVEKDANKELKFYKIAFKLGSIESAYSVAMCYKDMGNYISASKWLEKLINIMPNFKEAKKQIKLINIALQTTN